VVGQDWRLDGGALTVPEFRLEIAEIRAGNALARTPAGETLEIVTAIRGRLTLTGDGWQETLEPYETLVVPAAVSRYRIEGLDGSLSALGSVP
jgi:mannose-6-phosphate isomerase class I